MSKALQVSLAFITNAEQRVLIAQRSKNSDMGGCWEFPGGKIEHQEKPEEALKRELFEELGIIIHTSHFVTQLMHDYPSKTVLLHVYHVMEYSGVLHCCEKQQGMRWVEVHELAQYDLLDAGFRLIPYLASLLSIPYEPHHV